MATLKNGTHETIVIDGVPHWGLRVWAGVNGFDADGVKYVARTARKNAIPDDNGRLVSTTVVGARTTFGNRWIIPVNTNVDVVPEYVPGQRATKRADGRMRFVVYLSDTEYKTLRTKHDIVDLREKRKQRRAQRKLASAKTADVDADANDPWQQHVDTTIRSPATTTIETADEMLTRAARANAKRHADDVAIRHDDASRGGIGDGNMMQ